MVIVRLYGGLGNQMYQYAVGSVLAKRLNTKLKMDFWWFDAIKGNPDVVQRVYELDGFGIEPLGINPADRLLLKLKPAQLFQEKNLGYNKEFTKLKGSVILDGYWQSYKYFVGYEGFVTSLFKFPSDSSSPNRQLFAEVSDSESISLHVRRGDYTSEGARKYHGLMPLSYYKRALAKIIPSLKSPSLFVFSDDIEWSRKNIVFGLPTTYVDSNSPANGVEDMKLMSNCKHNIIANSSFSWWAAWLNPNPSKQVCAPRNWFVGTKYKLGDRVPESWIII